MSFLKNPSMCLVVLLCLFLTTACNLSEDQGVSRSAADVGCAYGFDKRVEIPWINGAFRHVLDPPGKKGDPLEREWYINDHCFYVEDNGTIHWFGITNPYPENGRYYDKGTHHHIGHATAQHPFGPWQEHPDALTTVGTEENIGACWVTKAKDHYVMIFGYNKGFTIATSQDLYNWQTSEQVDRINLGQGTRDPCVLGISDGTYLLYSCCGHDGFGATGLAKSNNCIDWKILEPAFVSNVKGKFGPLESPCVYERNGLYYLFVNHSHHQYQETWVFVSDNPYKFERKTPICTLFAHAAELFEWQGKTYISHCGIEDQHWNRTGLYLAELCWMRPH